MAYGILRGNRGGLKGIMSMSEAAMSGGTEVISDIRICKLSVKRAAICGRFYRRNWRFTVVNRCELRNHSHLQSS